LVFRCDGSSYRANSSLERARRSPGGLRGAHLHDLLHTLATLQLWAGLHFMRVKVACEHNLFTAAKSAEAIIASIPSRAR
jgi:hypothetical protein